MALTDTERAFVEAGRVGRLATADARGRPSVVPVCYAFDGGTLVVPIDEKPKRGDPQQIRRVRDVESNPFVAVVVDRYDPDWSRLGWVRILGRAAVDAPSADGHAAAVAALREKYDQYESHALDERPLLRIEPGSAVSWGALTPP